DGSRHSWHRSGIEETSIRISEMFCSGSHRAAILKSYTSYRIPGFPGVQAEDSGEQAARTGSRQQPHQVCLAERLSRAPAACNWFASSYHSDHPPLRYWYIAD